MVASKKINNIERTLKRLKKLEAQSDVPPAEGEKPTGEEPPIQPPGRSGLTWKAAINGLRDVLVDQTEDAIRSAWQRFRILDAIDLMAANHPATPPAERKVPAVLESREPDSVPSNPSDK